MENKRIVFALGAAALTDTVSYCLVLSSMLFFISEKGGNKDQYGLLLSLFSVASFFSMSVYGPWSDTGSFRRIYLIAFSIAIVGGLMYFLASSPWMIGLSRIISGIGAGNITLNAAYIARMVKKEERTAVLSVVNGFRILGITAAPALNLLVVGVNVNLFDKFYIDPYNSVGLIMAIQNAVVLFMIYSFLEDPVNDYDAKSDGDPKSDDDPTSDDDPESDGIDEAHKFQIRKVMSSIFSTSIGVYMMGPICYQSSQALNNTAFTPIAYDVLQWKQVKISIVGAFLSLVAAAGLTTVVRLSSRGVKDETLLKFGLTVCGSSSLAIYFCWTNQATALALIAPYSINAFGVFFMTSPSRALFIEAIANTPHLARHQGKMQSLLNMLIAVSRAVVPVITMSIFLKKPDDFTPGIMESEFTYYYFIFPSLFFVTLLGVCTLNEEAKCEMEAGENEVLSKSKNSNGFATFKEEVKRDLEAEDKQDSSILNNPTTDSKTDIYESNEIESVVEAQAKDVLVTEENVAAAMQQPLLTHVEDPQKDESSYI